MIENGYIRYKYVEYGIDEDGNPSSGEPSWSEMIPACVEGNRSNQGSNSETSSRYSDSSYTIYTRLGYQESNRIEVFDRQRRSLGEFSIRTRQVSMIVEEVRYTI